MEIGTIKTVADLKSIVESDDGLQSQFLETYDLESIDQATDDNWEDALDWYKSL